MTLKTILKRLKINNDCCYYGSIFCPEADETKVEDYLRYLHDTKRLSYTFIDKVLRDEVGVFYHNNQFWDGYIQENVGGEYDYIEVDEDGRIGIWCEVDGFIAWLDEFNKTWWLDEEEYERDKVEAQKLAEEMFKEFHSSINDAFNTEIPKGNKVKIKKFKALGIGDYKRCLK